MSECRQHHVFAPYKRAYCKSVLHCCMCYYQNATEVGGPQSCPTMLQFHTTTPPEWQENGSSQLFYCITEGTTSEITLPLQYLSVKQQTVTITLAF